MKVPHHCCLGQAATGYRHRRGDRKDAAPSASCCDRVVAKLPRPGGPSRSSRQRAAEAIVRRAKFFGSHAPRDKDRERTSRKIGRESMT